MGVLNKKKSKVKRNYSKGHGKRTAEYLFMLLPGTVFMLIFNYLPLPGILLAFKKYKFHKPPKDAGWIMGNPFINSMVQSDWNGFDNFKFLVQTKDALIATRNTVLYNLVFIFLGLVLSVALAIAITELIQKRAAKAYQTIFFLPFFLSWIAVSYLLYALLNTDLGILNNKFLQPLGLERVLWYQNVGAWPFIFVLANMWKYTGHGSIIYIASITGFDPQLYEAAAIDGASKWQQITRITLPLLTPIMIILTILAVGRIFRADFAMFYSLPNGSGILRPTTLVLDVYVYEMLRTGSAGLGRPAAAGLYQSVVGCILIVGANKLAKVFDDNYALF